MKKKYILLVVLLMVITLGYAILTTNLNINGFAEINNPTWDVHFENLQLDSENNVTGTQTITNDTTVTYNVTLSKPGDYYAFTVDVVNEGSIDAMVSAITNTTLTAEQLKYLDYSITYSDGVAINSKDKLVNTTGRETILVSVAVKDDAKVADLPTSNVTFSLKTSVSYVQADDTAVKVVHDSLATFVTKVKTGNVTASDVGTTFTVDMGAYGTHILRVANVSSDWEYCGNNDYSQTACGIVLEFADIIARYNMNPTGEYKGTEYYYGWNIDGWPSSAMRDFLNDTSSNTYTAYVTSNTTTEMVTSVYNALPKVLRDAIIETNVISGYGSTDANGTGPNGTWKSTDKLYLLDDREIFGTSFTYTNNTATNYERQLDYYSNIGVSTSSYSGAMKYFAPYSTSNGYFGWLRSANSDDSNGFWSIDDTGGYTHGYGAYYMGGLSPAFRIG